jgi:hypothetical protein
MKDASFILGHEKLTALFGQWPCFHDAEVIDFTLNREEPAARAQIRVFNHAVVTLRFANVVDLELWGFNEQNAIFDLKIEPESGHPDVTGQGPAYRVVFESSYGMGASYLCASIEVESALPGLPPAGVNRRTTHVQDLRRTAADLQEAGRARPGKVGPRRVETGGSPIGDLPVTSRRLEALHRG